MASENVGTSGENAIKAENQLVLSEEQNDDNSHIKNGKVATEQSDTSSAQPNQQEGRISFFAIAKALIVRALIIYFITSFFRGPQTTTTNVGSETHKPSANLFNNGTIMDMYVYLSEDDFITDFNGNHSLVWFEEGLVYGDWYSGPNGDGTLSMNIEYFPSENVLKNGSLYIHVYFIKSGYSPDPQMKGRYSRTYTVYKQKALTKYKRVIQKLQRLLIGSNEEPETPQPSAGEIVSHWHPNLTINIVNDQTHWVQGGVPPPLDEYVQFEPTTGKYYPLVYLNDYWNLQRDYHPINETTKPLNLMLTYQPISLFRWQLYTAQSMRSRWTSSFLGDGAAEETDEEQDSIKEAFIETNPYLLAITIAVSVLHTIFELLAFKNDIQFWKNRRSLEGLSVRSVFFNVFQSLIVLLYVLDNETNTLVRISVFVGLIIDIWKIHKVVNVEINREEKIMGIFPKIKYSDKGSYVDSSTKEYDTMAFKYLSWLLFPLLIGYSVYSLLYLEHKGWYSWVLSMLYGFLLTFGFIMMTPQLFINYKLKSVAHMPWRMMTYKALNTFIDDIFAFVIKMPTMYRLGCFRDDIVFFIFLYQRWIYQVDPKRVNEFGTSAEMEQEMKNDVRSIDQKEPTEKKND